MNGKNYVVCSVKDELTNKFLAPMYFDKVEEAIRWFKFTLNKTELWASNPSMYTLYKIAEFNDENGYTNTEITLVQGGTAVLERS